MKQIAEILLFRIIIIFEKSVFCSLVMLYLSITSIAAYPQDREIDSLNSLLSKVTGNERGEVLLQLGIKNYNKDKNEAITNFNEALHCLNDSLQIVRTIVNKAFAFESMSRFSEIAGFVLPILPFAKKKNLYSYLSKMYGILAVSYSFQGNYQESIRYHYSSLFIRERLGDAETKANGYVNLGLLYYKLRNNTRALDYFRYAVKLESSIGKKSVFGFSNAALCYIEIDSPMVALLYLDKARNNCRPEQVNEMIQINFGFGMAFLKLNRLEESKSRLRQSLLCSRTYNDSRMEAENLVYMARVFLKTSEFDSAKNVLCLAEEIAIRENLNEILLDCCRQSIELFQRTGAFDNLASYQEKFIRQKEKMYYADLARDLAIAEGDKLEEEHLKKIQIQEEEISHQEAILWYQKWIGWSGVVSTGLLMVLIWLQYQSFRQKKAIMRMLEKRVDDRIRQLRDKQQRIKGKMEERTMHLNLLSEKIIGELQIGKRRALLIASLSTRNNLLLMLERLHREFIRADEQGNILPVK